MNITTYSPKSGEEIIWTKEKIVQCIKTSNKHTIAALMRIYSFQEQDEKSEKQTKFHNGMGFNKFDAPLLSSFAEQVNKHGYLYQKQIIVARKKLIKYADQILDYIDKNKKPKPVINTTYAKKAIFLSDYKQGELFPNITPKGNLINSSK